MSDPGQSPSFFARAARSAGPLKRLRGWNRIVNRLCPIAGGERCLFDVDFFGLRYRGNLGNIIDREVFFYGAYEGEELAFVRSWAQRRRGGIALDVGANVGHHAMAYSKMFDAVHAFEPSPAPHAILKDNVATNSIQNIFVHPFGLWNCDADLSFNLAPASNLGMGSFKEDVRTPEGFAPIRLPVKRGDDFLESIGVSAVDFIKIDVQGAESEVLQGLAKTLAKSPPFVWLEISATTRQDLPNLAALRTVFPKDAYEALIFARSHVWLKTAAPRPITADEYQHLDGNLMLVPRDSL